MPSLIAAYLCGAGDDNSLGTLLKNMAGSEFTLAVFADDSLVETRAFLRHAYIEALNWSTRYPVEKTAEKKKYQRRIAQHFATLREQLDASKYEILCQELRRYEDHLDPSVFNRCG